jgi:hypothetical protein
MFLGWGQANAAGITLLEQELIGWKRMGLKVYLTRNLCLLAESCLLTGSWTEGVEVITEALAIASQTKEQRGSFNGLAAAMAGFNSSRVSADGPGFDSTTGMEDQPCSVPLFAIAYAPAMATKMMTESHGSLRYNCAGCS